MAKTDVAEVKNTAVSADVFDYGEDRGQGFEGIGINDMSIPFFNILQPTSPEVAEQTIEGCRAGDIVNSVTKEIVKQPIIIQPVKRDHLWVEWIPRLKGGGLVASHDPASEVVRKVIDANGGSSIPPKGSDGKRIPFRVGDNELVETYYYYCLLLDETGMDNVGFCVLSFTSTKIKVQKDWMTAMMTQRGQPPIFANRCLLSSIGQRNDAGQPYFNYKITGFGGAWRNALIPPNEEWGRNLLTGAKDFMKMIDSGMAKIDQGGAADDIAATAASSGDAEIPF
jgi:hypothetical protein